MSQETNRIRLAGTVAEDVKYSHSMYGESFYDFPLKVRRRSGNHDVLNVTISDRLMTEIPRTGDDISIKGQIRTYNENLSGTNRLKIVVFCLNPPETAAYHVNEVFLEGYLCREPYYRITPSGRELSDIILAVNRGIGKSDYIPCIVWGRNARYLQNMHTGTHLKISGRLQSRMYNKVFDDGSAIKRTAYEVSVVSLEVLENAGL